MHEWQLHEEEEAMTAPKVILWLTLIGFLGMTGGVMPSTGTWASGV